MNIATTEFTLSPTAVTAWCIRAPGGHLLPMTTRCLRRDCVRDYARLFLGDCDAPSLLRLEWRERYREGARAVKVFMAEQP